MSTFTARKKAAQRNGISPAKLLATSALTAAGLIALAAPLHAQAQTIDANALPEGENVILGNATYDRTTPNVLGITQHDARVVAEYLGGFNIGENASVLMYQQSTDTFVHIDRSANTSVINGLFQGAGSNWILNANGVLIGESARIDMNSFGTSTGEIDRETFAQSGQINLDNLQDGQIIVIEEGARINVAEAGLAAFVAPTVINNGVINAKLGTVAFAAGEQVTIDLYGDGLVELTVEGELADALLENKGTINAEGGTVQMSALAAKDVVDNIINVEGVITVASAEVQGGKIILSGGDAGKVSVSGTLDATGTMGGDIEVTGQYVSAESGAVLDASGVSAGGNIKFGGAYQGGGDTPTADYAYVDANAILRANADEDGDGGEVVVWSDFGTGVYGDIEAKGGANSGNGGFVEVSSAEFFDFKGNVNTSAANGETGMLLLDPRDVIIRIGTADGSDSGGSSSFLNVDGFVAAATGPDTFTIWESEIENQSVNNNITIQARRSISADGTGTILLADNRTLTLETSNNVSGNAGGIDLTGSAFCPVGTCGTLSANILFETQDSSGNQGNIIINAATSDVAEGNIILGDLRSERGDIIVNTKRGYIRSTGTVETTRGGDVNFSVDSWGSAGQDNTNAGDILIEGLIDTATGNGVGNVTLSAADDIRITSTGEINTSRSGSDGNITLNAGSTSNQAYRIDLDGIINAGESGLVAFNAGLVELASNILAASANLSGTATRVEVENGSTEIQDGLDVAAAGATINVGAGTYNENLTVSKANIKLDGAPGTEIIGNGSAAVITVNAAGFNLDPVTIDANGADYGVVVNAGAFNGFSSVGNTYQNADLAGIRINGTGATGTADIGDNIFEGNNANGIYVSGLSGTAIANITGNTIGTVGDTVNFDGIIVGPVSGGTLNVTGNTINAEDNGIAFNATVANVVTPGGAITGGTVNIHDNIIRANQDGGVVGSGIYFGGSVTNAAINIGDGGRAVDPSNFIVVGPAGDDDTDGIHFAGDVGTGAVVKIDGNRIGHLGTPGVQASMVGGDLFGDGIQFNTVSGNADIDITDNNIVSDTGDGIKFAGSVGGTANVTIGGPDGNAIGAPGRGIAFLGTVTGQALLTVNNNFIVTTGDGVLFNAAVNNALNPASSEEEILIAGNFIASSAGNGVNFNGAVSGARHDTRITGNEIHGNGAGNKAIRFGSTINDAEVRIHDNTKLRSGASDAIYFGGEIQNNALVEINDNTEILGEGDDGIDFNANIVGGSVARINGNDNIVGNDNGIEFAGVNGSTVEIIGNNHGIHALGHGIYYGGNISGATLNIHDNIIDADTNENDNGDGIHFAGTISNATVNIGDGNGANEFSGHSNIISGHNGIYFAANVGNNADINIDGNRIGYNATGAGNPTYGPGARVTSDGISFGTVSDNADIDITDNWVRADDDGIVFRNNVDDSVNVLIGGDLTGPDGNNIDANDDGIQFFGTVEDNALVRITHNEINAEENGIEFNGTTSNFRNGNDEEILIAFNDIEGGEHGIVFYGEASDGRHDIVIRDNDSIIGNDDHGIAHYGNINDAELWILDNEEIWGEFDGVHIEGFFTNNARIVIDGNEDIDSDNGDGIEVTQFGSGGGVDLDITNNHIHWTGDNGIEVTNVDGVFIFNNEIHHTGGNGIDVVDSDDAQIRWNDVWNTDDDGIFVLNSDGSNIEDNDIDDAGDDGIDVRNSAFIEIERNDIDDSDGDGIQVRNSAFVEIDDNEITDSGDDGIDVENSAFVAITDNFIWNSDNNGIEVEDSAFITIDDNTSAANGESGIFVDPSFFVDVTNNTVFWNAIGIEFDAVTFGNIEDNNVFQNLVGISLEDSSLINVEDNTITNNLFGLWAFGGGNGYINVENNTFDDNFIHAGFNSGIIDFTSPLTGLGNTFEGGNIALFFDAWNGGRIVDPTVLSLVEKGGIANGYTYGGGGTYQTFNGTDVFPPTDFGGTIGEQTFEGQSDYFVYVTQGTFVDPITQNAIWLDGQESHYFWPASAGGPDDFIIPSDTGGILTQAQFDFLEDMFYHYRDAANRGIFFFGLVPNPDIDQERVINQFDPFGAGPSGLKITLTGLPSITGGTGGGGTPFNLNSIAPAAGGEDEPFTPEDLANIEPAAGGESANCWSDAVNAAAGGSSVNYDFGGTFEESIAAAANCGAQSF